MEGSCRAGGGLCRGGHWFECRGLGCVCGVFLCLGNGSSRSEFLGSALLGSRFVVFHFWPCRALRNPSLALGFLSG